MMFMASLDTKYAMVLVTCAGQLGLIHLISAVSSSLTRWLPHTGQVLGASNTTEGSLTQPLSFGMISPLLKSL